MILLRFDDICPTMNRTAWDLVEALIVPRDIRPIIAIVPDNCDPQLVADAPMPDFWTRMRQAQARGWSIALHGYQHCNVSGNSGLVGRWRKSEFAGVPREQQDEKLRRGINILRAEGIHPTVWIAPYHTFDGTTVSLLNEYGITIISDGFCRYPHRSNDGMLWIPQQLHGMGPRPPGVWTVCYHINDWDARHFASFESDIDRFSARITTLEDVVNRYGDRRLRWTDYAYLKPHVGYYLTRIEVLFYERGHRWRVQANSRGRAGREAGSVVPENSFRRSSGDRCRQI